MPHAAPRPLSVDQGSSRPDSPGGAVFPQIGGGSVRPAPQSWQRRLAYVALDLVNRLVPKQRDKVVLHSTIDLEDGILALVEELGNRGARATVLLEQPDRAARLRALTGDQVRLLPKQSRRAVLHFLTARYVFTTENVYGDRQPPSSQVVVNIWHGEPPTKVVARFFPGQKGLHCSYAPVMSTVGRAYRSAEFGLHPLRVPIVGAPRNDRMLRSDGEQVRQSLLGVDAGRPALLWLPSFRAGSWAGRTRLDAEGAHAGVPFPLEEVRRLDDWLVERGATIVLKLHPHDVASFPGDFRALRLLSQEEMEQRGLTLYTLLPAFDGLLTDVSSIWLDYLLLDRPMIFAFPDVDDYRAGRGLNLEPYEDWVPGPFVRDLDSLLAALQDVIDGTDPMAAERRRARLRFHEHHDDRSTARLLDGLGIPRR
jgi:CDP-glycerol glycerophosphotransferase